MTKELDYYINQYLANNSKKRFDRLIQELGRHDFPADKLELLCTSKEVRNLYNLAKFYGYLDRLLEAQFYLEMYINEHPKHVFALVEMQTIACRRKDLRTSYNVLKKIEQYGTLVETIRGVALHSMASGHYDRLESVITDLLETNVNDKFTLYVIYESIILLKDPFIMRKFLKLKNSEIFIFSSSGTQTKILKDILTKSLLNSLIQIKVAENI
ncbi:hypothetical protein [Paenibacillus sp. FSL H7-689]|uniref:hypothetical protein n=1 Tax=Paenibacillus sp. FSL H7-689 TaxID=1227349 RepID=UPI0003E1F53E|nr:hypothetical protein [Paenibacillus sp. FSL H7-689]ETT47819.1 hypothetical protein C170_21300 [Paenibacillus sp. FSL H7-689]